MPSRPIHAMQQKMNLIYMILCRAEIIKKPDINSFCDKSGIKYETLRSAIRNGGLTANLEEQIASFAGFDRWSEYWCDTSVKGKHSRGDDDGYMGRDTEENFHRYLLECHSLFDSDYRYIEADKPKSIDLDVFSFEAYVNGQVSSLQKRMDLFIKTVIDGISHPDTGIVYGFKTLRIRMSFYGGDRISMKLTSPTLNLSSPRKIHDAIIVPLGENRNCLWELRREDGFLRGIYALSDLPLCQIQGAELGDRIVIEITANPEDGALVDSLGAQAINSAKEGIIKILMQKKMDFHRKKNGSILLGKQQLVVTRADYKQ